MKEKYNNKKHVKVSPFCYLEGQYVIKCDMQYSDNCPRVCKLFYEEQGESQGINELKGIEKIMDKLYSSQKKDKAGDIKSTLTPVFLY